MISLLWILSIDLYTVPQHSLIKAVWNTPLPEMIRQCNEKLKLEELEMPLPFLNIQLTVSVVYNHSRNRNCALNYYLFLQSRVFPHIFLNIK